MKRRAAHRVGIYLLWGVALLSLRAVGQTSVPAAITPRDPTSVQAGILAAYRSGQKKVIVPPGVYALPSRNGCHLAFDDISDFEIEAEGVIWLLTNQAAAGVKFHHCRSVRVHGVIIRNATPPFTQGVIESIAADRRSCVIRVDTGYNADLDDLTSFPSAWSMYVFDRMTRQFKDGSGDYGCTSVKRLGPSRFEATFDALPPPVEAGDLWARRGKGRTGVSCNQCAQMKLENITVEYAGGFGFFEGGGEGGNHYVGIEVKPGPKPPGAIAEPLLSENADGFHSAETRRGPVIENSLFTRMPDDGIAIHGSYEMVEEVEAEKLTIGQASDSLHYAVGDRIEVVTKEGKPLGEAVVRSIDPTRAPEHLVSATNLKGFQNIQAFFLVTLDHVLSGVEPGAFTDNIDRLGNGYILRGNTIKNHRARGLLLKARDGLVENNLIEGSTIAGIILAPELWWAEAGYSQRVCVRGNAIRHVGYATSPGNRQASGMAILGVGTAPDAIGNRDITIENNQFVAIDRRNLVLDGAEDCHVRNNLFLVPQIQHDSRGNKKDLDPGKIIDVGRVRGIDFVDNVATYPGRSDRVPVGANINANDPAIRQNAP